jgi:hypothetical protein
VTERTSRSFLVGSRPLFKNTSHDAALHVLLCQMRGKEGFLMRGGGVGSCWIIASCDSHTISSRRFAVAEAAALTKHVVGGPRGERETITPATGERQGRRQRQHLRRSRHHRL